MPDALTFIIAALAVYRLTRMVIYDEGPLSVFDRIRQALRIYERNDWIGRGLTCAACVSFWVGVMVAIVTARDALSGALVALAYSAVAYALNAKVK